MDLFTWRRLVLYYPSTMALATFPGWKGWQSLCYFTLIQNYESSSNPTWSINSSWPLSRKGFFPLIKVPWHMIFVIFLGIKCLATAPSQKLFKSRLLFPPCHVYVIFLQLYQRVLEEEIRHAFCPELYLACRRSLVNIFLFNMVTINYRSILVKFSFSSISMHR